MIALVESLLNEEDVRATSSSYETEEAAKQDNFLLTFFLPSIVLMFKSVLFLYMCVCR